MRCTLNCLSLGLLASLCAASVLAQQPASDDPFAPSPAPSAVQPAPPAVIPPPQPAVQPVPTPPTANPAPIIPVPVNPAPVNPPADGLNYGAPPGTSGVVAVPGRYYPWGNTKGTWVPFKYNNQWHLYRSWCQ